MSLRAVERRVRPRRYLVRTIHLVLSHTQSFAFLFSERATASAIILSGPELKATVTFEGPIGPPDIESGTQLAQEVQAFEKSKHRRDHDNTMIDFSQDVDFEHLNLGEFHDDGDDFYDDDGLDDDQALAELTSEERKQRRQKQRKRALQNRQRKERQVNTQKKKVREEGELFVRTFKAEAKGWYRFCIRGTWYQVVAEVDLRKESELGGVTEAGHVFTFEEKAVAEEDKLMEADTAVEEGIKDEDFASTKDKLKSLRRLLSEIQSKQQQERHRLIVHAATNEHSHSRMVLGSLLETILFMVVTGVQIMTIRRWFKGAPVLGR